ncbi:MAG: helix-turn-helix domain-containing protein [Parabacteroides sp.]|nr:helix-turn-helix domain-containing protein [Parabacteroides sp.]
MNKKEIINVKIENFKNFNHPLDYIDDDLVLVRDLIALPHDEDISVRMDCFLIIYCIEGGIQFFMNGKEFFLDAGNVFFCLPSMVFNRVVSTVNHKVIIFGFSHNFLSRVIPRNKGIINAGFYIYKNPIHEVSNERTSHSLYRLLIDEKIRNMDQPYSRQIIHSLCSALFCEMMSYFQSQVGDDVPDVKREFSQAHQIYRRFLDKVVSDQGVHRSVDYYATELFYTSKYLSKIVREVSGKSPSTIIHEHAIEHIKFQLKRTEKPIKQIADEFEFPNISFFGKYVKKHLGASPSQYRKQDE